MTRGREIDPGLERMVVMDLRDGETHDDISETRHIPRSTVGLIAKRHGLSRRRDAVPRQTRALPGDQGTPRCVECQQPLDFNSDPMTGRTYQECRTHGRSWLHGA